MKMKIFFTASKSESKNKQASYNKIIEYLIKQNHDVISLEIMKYSDLLGKSVGNMKVSPELHYNFINKGISKSQAVVIEASKDSFRMGHEATLALLHEKPVLCLSDSKDYSSRIHNSKFYSYVYNNLEEIDPYLHRFLLNVKQKHLSVRKNIYLSAEHSDYLKSLAHKKSLSYSQLIRSLIEKEIKNPDDTHFVSKT